MGLLPIVVAVGTMTTARGSSTDNDDASVSFAWSVHDALSTWTGRVDTKASIVLTIELAALGFVTALTDDDNLFSALHGWREGLFRIGLVALGLAIFAATAVVFPQLSRRRSKRAWRDGFIYFGHLRHWEPQKLESKLAGLTGADARAALAGQLVTMSKVAWRKHVMLQAAVGLGLLAALAFVAVGVA
jgi:hypothetical protein